MSKRYGLRSVWVQHLTPEELARLGEIEVVLATLPPLYAELAKLRDKGRGRARYALLPRGRGAGGRP